MLFLFVAIMVPCIDRSFKVLKIKFRKIFIKMKNLKTFFEAQTASRLNEIVQSPAK